MVLDYTGMSFSPNKADFESGMERVVGKLEETVLCIQPLVMDPVFYPFTRPVLYGKQEDLAFKEGPSLQVRILLRNINYSLKCRTSWKTI